MSNKAVHRMRGWIPQRRSGVPRPRALRHGPQNLQPEIGGNHYSRSESAH